MEVIWIFRSCEWCLAFSPLCRFVPWLIHPLADLPPGFFASWLFHPLADLPPSLFAPWLIRLLPWLILSRISQGANKPGGETAKGRKSRNSCE